MRAQRLAIVSCPDFLFLIYQRRSINQSFHIMGQTKQLQKRKLTNRSPPSCRSSNSSQVPSTSSLIPLTVVTIDPPQACIVRLRSSSTTRPAQNMSLQQHTPLRNHLTSLGCNYDRTVYSYNKEINTELTAHQLYIISMLLLLHCRIFMGQKH